MVMKLDSDCQLINCMRFVKPMKSGWNEIKLGTYEGMLSPNMVEIETFK